MRGVLILVCSCISILAHSQLRIDKGKFSQREIDIIYNKVTYRYKTVHAFKSEVFSQIIAEFGKLSYSEVEEKFEAFPEDRKVRKAVFEVLHKAYRWYGSKSDFMYAILKENFYFNSADSKILGDYIINQQYYNMAELSALEKNEQEKLLGIIDKRIQDSLENVVKLLIHDSVVLLTNVSGVSSNKLVYAIFNLYRSDSNSFIPSSAHSINRQGCERGIYASGIYDIYFGRERVSEFPKMETQGFLMCQTIEGITLANYLYVIDTHSVVNCDPKGGYAYQMLLSLPKYGFDAQDLPKHIIDGEEYQYYETVKNVKVDLSKGATYVKVKKGVVSYLANEPTSKKVKSVVMSELKKQSIVKGMYEVHYNLTYVNNLSSESIIFHKK